MKNTNFNTVGDEAEDLVIHFARQQRSEHFDSGEGHFIVIHRIFEQILRELKATH